VAWIRLIPFANIMNLSTNNDSCIFFDLQANTFSACFERALDLRPTSHGACLSPLAPFYDRLIIQPAFHALVDQFTSLFPQRGTSSDLHKVQSLAQCCVGVAELCVSAYLCQWLSPTLKVAPEYIYRLLGCDFFCKAYLPCHLPHGPLRFATAPSNQSRGMRDGSLVQYCLHRFRFVHNTHLHPSLATDNVSIRPPSCLLHLRKYHHPQQPLPPCCHRLLLKAGTSRSLRTHTLLPKSLGQTLQRWRHPLRNGDLPVQLFRPQPTRRHRLQHRLSAPDPPQRLLHQRSQ